MGHSIGVFSSMLAASCVLFLNLIAGTVSNAACLLDQNRTNWAGTIVFSADCLQVAASIQKIRTLVRSDEKVWVHALKWQLPKMRCASSVTFLGK